jgi:hypothetical protein
MAVKHKFSNVFRWAVAIEVSAEQAIDAGVAKAIKSLQEYKDKRFVEKVKE